LEEVQSFRENWAKREDSGLPTVGVQSFDFC
jgi:hypothetical protein